MKLFAATALVVTLSQCAPECAPTTNWSTNWDRKAYCESGGNWSHAPVTNSTGTYSGGLMIWEKAWISYGGQQFAPWAYQASKGEQIVIAERIWDDYGQGAWDCR